MAVATSPWFGRAVFGSLGVFATLAAMLPLGLQADAMVMPDILFCLAFAWVVRRPLTAPLVLIFCLSIFADFMLMRPLGLWTLVLIGASELARAQRVPIREQMFVLEWLIFTCVFGAALLANAILLKISFSAGPTSGLALNFFINTVLAYPFVVAMLHWVFRIRAPRTPSGFNRLGRVT